jgi:hypothetical protein
MMSTLKNTQGESRSPVPWTPEEHAEYKAAYAAELAADPSADAGQLLRRAAVPPARRTWLTGPDCHPAARK